ncbi:tetratricopeptide repeat protein [Streptomyces sp. NPDC051940]|uniref:tetratricopeptide repeat protein n=1 Tax=Streptomyces sp. NPDC051940 TaxID=3155675 RepID=UPI00343EB4C6
MTTSDDTELRRAIWENGHEPESPARTARAERLLAEVEATGDRPLLITALFNLVSAYTFSLERDKMFVPFARVLRMFDERPEEFGGWEAHHLHWVFKWVSADMLDQPHIPLASISKWHAEMEQRYRVAGHSERAVRQGEHRIAQHVGDHARAERAFAAWLAADRDEMADCHACELHGQGYWQLTRGDDEAALRTWEPVLAGRHTCLHEPHAALASSLLPLLRLGRLDEARANHLRGWRLVRSMDSMRDAAASHIEFCALTGNEARGLELLAERPAYLTEDGGPNSLMEYLAVTAVLTRRLTALGHGAVPVPGPAGRTWTAASLAPHAEAEALALAARFDARNGTAAVSARVRERLSRQPLVDRLPLGVRAARPASAGAGEATSVRADAATSAPVGEGTTASAGEGTSAAGSGEHPSPAPDFAGLLAEARRLSEGLRPEAGDAWAAAERAADREGVELGAYDRAEFAAHRAARRDVADAEAAELLREAAAAYEQAEAWGEAVAAAAKAAYSLALAGDAPGAVAASAAALDRARGEHATGRAQARHLAAALLCRGRVLHELSLREPSSGGTPPGNAGDDLSAQASAALRELLDFAGPHGADPHLAVRISEAHARLGDLAEHREEPAEAAGHLRLAAETADGAGLGWFAVEPYARLAQVGVRLDRPDTAEEAALAALERGTDLLTPAGYSQLHGLLMDVYAGTDRDDRAAAHALQAAHWADEAGLSEGPGAWARLRLGGLYVRLGRTDEALAVLEAALVDLTAERHGDDAVVQARWWLGDCLAARQEHREAAEQYLLAADVAKDWPDKGRPDHARLAHLAAGALEQAGLRDEAARAFERAGELWRALGETADLVRTLRARAWLLAYEDGQEALALMERAVEECEAADADGLREVLADTCLQTARLLSRTGEDTELAALPWADRAAEAFRAAGDRIGVLDAELLAAWTESDGGREADARERARRIIGLCAGDDEETGPYRVEAESLLEYLSGE